MTDKPRIAVIGGGAAGMMAAGTATHSGADVTLFEHTDRLGWKLSITGKGRCNVTNNCSVTDFLDNVTKNPRFLYSALSAFSPADTMELFSELGVELKTERGMRVYPASDKAADIVAAMKKYSSDAKVIYTKIKSIDKRNGVFVVLADREYEFDRVIMATGGKSYPRTGSDGSGFRLARRLGHSITELIASLVPLESNSELCRDMQGLSLKNVGIKITDKNGRMLYSDFGEMMFSHFGVTGPVILSASAHLRNTDISSLTLSIDLKPALDEKALDKRLLSDFKTESNKDFINSLGGLLPSKMILPFVRYTGIDSRKKVNSITKEERRRILEALKSFSIPLSGMRPIEEAVVTSGGISTSEVSPKTLESKIVEGLFFAGEMLDVDAYTGGFNLQIAFSTGFLAGKCAAEN